jgi:KEOPS complex subunit Cgi121
VRLVAGTVSVADVDAFVAALPGEAYDCAVQAFDAAYVADRGHLEAAVAHANRAFERGENVASDRAVEILLYAAGRRQIRQALEMGVGEGEQDVVVVVDGGADGAGGDSDATWGTAQGGGSATGGGATTAPVGDEAGAAAAVVDVLEDGAVLEGDDALTDDGVYGDPAAIRSFFDVSDAELDAAAGDLAGVVRERVALLDVEK